ncbi:HD domain-containing protein [Candidatus Endoriftia persephone]|jgi:hypothetical protein|uniref:Guanosine-3',5'-bis(Diphosphate) 3'-diphosphatase n=3 Tax=Gammaproteobacteria TaxID=1236 RepID=G2FER5_9GAMM|nr:HD domain-containing protein [Candidatus Endoriftia persephone]EGW54647.1 guanosine-3',5'-bis(diphosphate) 3'-diphosphatase [endosymbiont of Tevnia jerichonana (vent Tica)]USF88468.1 HD domain-containing protein [Candidatus Endoriftia persephone]
MNDFVEKARAYATQAHARIDQRRKYSNQPYDEHLKRVAELVEEVSDDPQMIAAAWLHDTVEDTPATHRDIEREFGAGVAQLVDELTDVSRPGDGNRALRKALDREHIARASVSAKTVKLADLIDNCRDICRHDPRFARVYLAEMEALLRVLQESNETLLKRAHKVWNRCRERLGAEKEASRHESEMFARHTQNASFDQWRALRLFTESFSASDIAEPLGSFDSDTSAIKAHEIMLSKGWSVAGLREDGVVEGYILRDDLQRGYCGDYRRSFSRGQLVRGDAPLSDVIYVLTRHASCFVNIIGGTSGIIIREHIQKPIVRMWLFGMITIIEINLVKRIEESYPDESWQSQLNDGRLDKAREMQQERQRRGQISRLIDCLQFSDKAQILIKDEVQLAWMGFDSRRVAKKALRDLESLRNNLAHSQDIVSHDWPQIARMTQRIEFLMGFGEE